MLATHRAAPHRTSPRSTPPQLWKTAARSVEQGASQCHIACVCAFTLVCNQFWLHLGNVHLQILGLCYTYFLTEEKGQANTKREASLGIDGNSSKSSSRSRLLELLT